MTFPIKITDDPVNTDIIYNNKWKLTDYYRRYTKNEGYCSSYLYTIDKQIAETANEALIYLLQRSIIEEEGWTEQMMAEVTPEELSSFILNCGYLHTPKGVDLPIDNFWGNYIDLATGMQKEKSYALTKNGVPIPEIDLEFHEKRYILSATSFDYEWNSMQFFFETYTHWGFFRWSTGA
ncbi:MAG TPA: hypothetical protein VIM79_11310 [Niastella sp.]